MISFSPSFWFLEGNTACLSPPVKGHCKTSHPPLSSPPCTLVGKTEEASARGRTPARGPLRWLLPATKFSSKPRTLQTALSRRAAVATKAQLKSHNHHRNMEVTVKLENKDGTRQQGPEGYGGHLSQIGVHNPSSLFFPPFFPLEGDSVGVGVQAQGCLFFLKPIGAAGESRPRGFLRSSFKGCHSFAKRQRNILTKYRSLLARNAGNVREYYKTGCKSWPRAMS